MDDSNMVLVKIGNFRAESEMKKIPWLTEEQLDRIGKAFEIPVAAPQAEMTDDEQNLTCNHCGWTGTRWQLERIGSVGRLHCPACQSEYGTMTGVPAPGQEWSEDACAVITRADVRKLLAACPGNPIAERLAKELGLGAQAAFNRIIPT
jgi:hypothetical protein